MSKQIIKDEITQGRKASSREKEEIKKFTPFEKGQMKQWLEYIEIGKVVFDGTDF